MKLLLTMLLNLIIVMLIHFGATYYGGTGRGIASYLSVTLNCISIKTDLLGSIFFTISLSHLKYTCISLVQLLSSVLSERLS